MRAASALVEAFGHSAPDVDAIHVDTLQLGPRWVRSIYDDLYELLAARAPGVWRRIYRQSDDAALLEAGRRPLAELFRSYRQLVGRDRWDLIVCTHSLPCQLAARLEHRPPIHLVVTDFALHSIWVQPVVSRFYVPLEAQAVGLRKKVPGVSVAVTGIPISGAFGSVGPPEACRRNLGLALGVPVITVTSGGMGLHLERTVEATLVGCPEECHVLAVCGRNRAAFEHLVEQADPRLRVFGFVEDMPGLLAAADLVVAKPGGLTCSEALALGKPLVLTSPIPGHEEDNARVLVRHGAARFAPLVVDIPDAVRSILTEASERERLAAAAAALGRPSAADVIATMSLERNAASA